MEDGSTIVNSTKIQLEEFKDSIVWNDIINELNVWKESFEIERGTIVDSSAESNPSTASVLMHLGDINGRLKTVEFVKSLPDVLLEILAIKAEEDKLNKEVSDGY